MPTAPARQTQESFAGSFGSFAGSFWSHWVFVGSLRSFDRFLSPLLGPSVLRWVVDSFVGSLIHSTGPSVLRHIFRHVLRHVLQSVGLFGGFVRSFGGPLYPLSVPSSGISGRGVHARDGRPVTTKTAPELSNSYCMDGSLMRKSDKYVCWHQQGPSLLEGTDIKEAEPIPNIQPLPLAREVLRQKPVI